MRTIRHTATVALCVVCTLALTGCFAVDVGVGIDRDGSGTVTIDMTFSAPVTSLLTLDGQVPAGELEDGFVGDLGDDTTVDAEVVDGQLQITATAAFDDPAGLTELLTSSTSGSEPLFDTFELAGDGDRWTVAGTVAGGLDSGGLDSGGLDGEALGFDVPGLDGLAPTAAFSVTFPGEVTDANSDDIAGDTVTWDLTTTREIRAEAAADRGGVPTWVLASLAAVTVGVVAGATAVYLWGRRRPDNTNTGNSDTDSSDTDSSDTGSAGPAGVAASVDADGSDSRDTGSPLSGDPDGR